MAITLTELGHKFLTNYMNPEMACSSLLTSSRTIYGDVISSCIINKTNKILTVSAIPLK